MTSFSTFISSVLTFISSVLFFLIPIAALVFFIVSLILYIIAKSKNKRIPGTYSPEQIKTRKICLIVSSIILGIFLVVVLSFIGLLMMAVAFM